jgi:hypothetical protein
MVDGKGKEKGKTEMLKIHKSHNLFPQCLKRFEFEVKKISDDLMTSNKWFYEQTRKRLTFYDFEWFYVPEYDLIVRKRLPETY